MSDAKSIATDNPSGRRRLDDVCAAGTYTKHDPIDCYSSSSTKTQLLFLVGGAPPLVCARCV